jgi:Myb-like DNA-binding domain
MVEDAKLCEMKEQNATWKQILETLDNKTKSQLQERYKQLMKFAPKSDEARKAEEKKKAIAENKKAENLAKAAGGKSAKNDKGKGKADDKVF